MDPRQNKSGDSNNLMWALIVSVLVMVGFDYLFGDQMKPQPQATVGTQASTIDGLLQAPAQDMEETTIVSSQPTAQTSTRIPVETNYLSGSIALTGGRLDELVLPEHLEGNGEEEKAVTLLAPTGAKTHFFDAGWQSADVSAPFGNTVWKTVGEKLTSNSPLTLMWMNETGQRFERTFQVQEDKYTVKVVDKITNAGDKPVRLSHYAQIHKKKVKPTQGAMFDPEASTFFRFIGPQAFLDDMKYEMDYDDLKEGQTLEQEGRKGWVGVTDRYFISAILPNQKDTQKINVKHTAIGADDYYTMLVQGNPQVVYPTETLEVAYRVYAGPQLLSEMEAEDAHLGEAVDYGWFHFIARPLFDMIMFFASYTNNLGVAIILGTIVLKILLFPLANKSYRSMAVMRKIQPKMNQLKEKYGDQREKFAMEMMALYKEHKVNPASGCWPMLIQIPIFFAFYKVLLISYPFRHAPFFGWIQDLSEMDPYFVLPILMGLSMWVQQKLTPPAADPIQQKVMKFLPWIFTAMFAMFPSGLVLYWFVNNVLSIAQQYYIQRKYA